MLGERGIPRLTADQVISILRRNGFVRIASAGSHQKWRNAASGKQVIVAYHCGRILPRWISIPVSIFRCSHGLNDSRLQVYLLCRAQGRSETKRRVKSMKTKVQRWGNSLAVRIPKVIAVESSLDDGSLVDLKLVSGSVVLTPVRGHKHRLQELLSGITEDNVHREVDTGRRVGSEAW